MKKHFLFWLLASLVMPLLVAIFKSDFGGLVLVFWPGSIMLISLGAEPRPIIDVAYVWSVSIFSNIVLYICIWFIFTKIKHHLKSNEQ